MVIILLLTGAVIGGLVSWGIAQRYYKKSSKEQKDLIEKLSKDIKEVNTFRYFEDLLENSKWKKETIEHHEIWISEKDNTFQIETGKLKGEFHEPWTDMYPSPLTMQYPVYLKINNTRIKELPFISLDGGRIFVPITERKFNNNKASYFWNLKSLPLKVCKVIGEYYIYKNICGVARVSKIEIID